MKRKFASAFSNDYPLTQFIYFFVPHINASLRALFSPHCSKAFYKIHNALSSDSLNTNWKFLSFSLNSPLLHPFYSHHPRGFSSLVFATHASKSASIFLSFSFSPATSFISKSTSHWTFQMPLLMLLTIFTLYMYINILSIFLFYFWRVAAFFFVQIPLMKNSFWYLGLCAYIYVYLDEFFEQPQSILNITSRIFLCWNFFTGFIYYWWLSFQIEKISANPTQRVMRLWSFRCYGSDEEGNFTLTD